MFRPIVAAKWPVILVGGATLEPDDLNISRMLSAMFVAADSGADAILTAGFVPEAVIGDLDSISDTAREAFADRLHLVAEQDTTDFEKALCRINAPVIVAIGFMGGRLDHQMAVLNVVMRFREKAVVLVGPEDVVFVAPTKTVLDLPVGTRVALLPMGDARVDTDGLQWDIKDAALHPSSAISAANASAAQRVTIHAMGQLLITLPRDCLSVAIDVVRAQ